MTWLTQLWETVKKAFADFLSVGGIQILLAALAAIAGVIIIKLIFRSIKRRMIRRGKVNALSSFLLSISKVLLYILLFIIVISILGIPVTSFIVILGSASIAIGLAMQGTLSNFISGIMLIMTKPFGIGDYTDLSGKAGTVKSIGILNTTLITPDNKLIVISNGEVTQNVITNYNYHKTRRVDLKFSVAYGADIAGVKRIVGEVLKAHPDVLDAAYAKEDAAKEGAKVAAEGENSQSGGKRKKKRIMPEKLRLDLSDEFDPKNTGDPMVRLNELGASSLDFVARVWVRTEKYWDVYFDLNEQILGALTSNNIRAPFSQHDVRMK